MAEEIENIMTGESRNASQKVAMTAIYDMLTYVAMGKEVDVQSIVSSLCEMPYEDAPYFVKAAVLYAIKFHNDAVAVFNENMRKWTFARLNRLEQAILLLAYVHFYHIDEKVDKGVVIDIAVKQAKAYLDEKDYRFVNAILDKVLTR